MKKYYGKQVFCLLCCLLLATTTYAGSFFFPGMGGVLKDEENGIPAHPDPGVNSVSFSFDGGEQVEVIDRDFETGWINVKNSSNQAGWILERYVRKETATYPDISIDWCPSKKSPQPGSNNLKIASWNLGNLHSVNGQSTYIGARPSVKRYTKDYKRIRCYVRAINPDILAVQEVDGEEALKRIVDLDVYNVHVSKRPRGRNNGKQNTGFAYKKGLSITELPDLTSLNTSGGLRYGTQIEVNWNGKRFKMLSVHLKSGCFNNNSNTDACPTLVEQIPKLEKWIDKESKYNRPMIVLGDFNRSFNLPCDGIWDNLDDGKPSNSDLETITKGKHLNCRDNEYSTFIDHIVFNKLSWEWVLDDSFQHYNYRNADMGVWNLISDHCPIIVDLTMH